MKNDREESKLVKAVLALDGYFSELERIGAKINSLEMKSDFDFEHAQRLLGRYAECGEGVGTEITQLSAHLNEARARAEAMAEGVAARATMIVTRKNEQQKKMDAFQVLGEKVRQLNTAISDLRRPEGEAYTEEDRAKVTHALAQIEGQLGPLIEEAQSMRKDAQESKMKALEQNADSLTQTLQTIRSKLSSLHLVVH